METWSLRQNRRIKCCLEAEDDDYDSDYEDHYDKEEHKQLSF
jgi:hypothetical protein